MVAGINHEGAPNEMMTLQLTRHACHLGFVRPGTGGRYWSEERAGGKDKKGGQSAAFLIGCDPVGVLTPLGLRRVEGADTVRSLVPRFVHIGRDREAGEHPCGGGPQQGEEVCSLLAGVKPGAKFFRFEDRRHPLVERCHQRIRRGGDDGAGLQHHARGCRVLPALPQAGQGEGRVVLAKEVIGLPRLGTLLPLVEAARRDDAAPFVEGLAEGGFFCQRLGPCVNHPVADLHVLRPVRYQPPVQQEQFSLVFILADGGDLLGGGDVVAVLKVQPFGELEIVDQIRDREMVGEAAAHRRILADAAGVGCWGIAGDGKRGRLLFKKVACPFLLSRLEPISAEYCFPLP